MDLICYFKVIKIEVLVFFFLGTMATAADSQIKTKYALVWREAHAEKIIDRIDPDVLHLAINTNDEKGKNTGIQNKSAMESPNHDGTDSQPRDDRREGRPPLETKPKAPKPFVPSKKIEPDQAVDFPYDI
jgi:hypothetical protein